MDCLTEELRKEAPWTMMFADGVVISSESKAEVKERLKRWRSTLEDRGMHISGTKTEYLCMGGEEEEDELKMQGVKVLRVTEFRYLKSTVQTDGGNKIEVMKRIAVRWNSWRKVTSRNVWDYTFHFSKINLS